MVSIVIDRFIFYIGILVRCSLDTGAYGMKKHAASMVVGMSMCGRDCTYDEYEAMKKREATHVNCKHCLRLMK